MVGVTKSWYTGICLESTYTGVLNKAANIVAGNAQLGQYLEDEPVNMFGPGLRWISAQIPSCGLDIINQEFASFILQSA